jgi:hypothetical protein
MHWHQSGKNCFLAFRFENLWLTHPEFISMIKKNGGFQPIHWASPKCIDSSEN